MLRHGEIGSCVDDAQRQVLIWRGDDCGRVWPVGPATDGIAAARKSAGPCQELNNLCADSHHL
jgi:hypothetical protein